MASFVGHEAGKAVFVGLYKVNGHKPLSYRQYWEEPLNAELRDKYDLMGATDKSTTTLWFNLDLMDFRQEWKGKLIVCWPGRELSYWRWANQNEFQIHAITEDSVLDRELPKWDQLILNWNELAVLPKRWCDKISQWRGIYFILDVSDGKGYVGAAYGEENLLQRWRGYSLLPSDSTDRWAGGHRNDRRSP